MRKLFVLIWMACLYSFAQSQVDPADLIKPLIDPVKLATLKERGANQRVHKITAILWKAKQAGQDPAKVADKAVGLIGWANTPKGQLTAAAMVRNLTIAEKLGATNPHFPALRFDPIALLWASRANSRNATTPLSS